MRNNKFKKVFSCILGCLLITALTCTTGCNKDNHVNTPITNEQTTVLGEGETTFNFIVVDKEKNESAFEIHTDETIVGEALLQLGLIQGDESEFGLYVKTVNGIHADYDTDGTYWAFYVDGEYATSGVDTTEITEGSTYSFKVEK